MRAYEKKRQIIAECRKQMEKYLRKDSPDLTPAQRSKLARHYVGEAVKEMERSGALSQ